MLNDYEFWFVVGSQFLYGPEVLETVSARAAEMADALNASGNLPCKIVYKVTAKTNAEITDLVREANYNKRCAGLITWCHTFSPGKMWINGFATLQKPYCHFATQYNREIPNEGIDMDFMNLNQAAHGDREHGFTAARLRVPRKVIAGYWQDTAVQKRLGDWMRAAVGAAVSKELKVMRFGDNMREVAVTEGDKVEVQAKLGWQVNTWPVGQLVEAMHAVTEAEIDALMAQYRTAYDFAADDAAFTDTVRYQAREELAIKKMLDAEGCRAFSNTFQDLYGMRQLPGLASQHLMAQGYGYGGEGDWKVAAMTAIIKAMGEGKTGGTAFMEDYTYNLVPGAMYSLGAHMLEVCPSVAAARPRIEVHPLGIGDREPPARLVFEGHEGSAIVVSLVDMGGRLRLICQDIHCVKPILPMPNLPVARVMWQAMPDLTTGLECWISAGGAHHTTLTYDVSAEQMQDWARMMDVEFVHITADTTVEGLEQQLFLGSGKTTTLRRTIAALQNELRIGVMEADIDSDVDARAIAETGAKAIQLHTGGMCHLDAEMTRQGLAGLGTGGLDLVILENVGNLVCPAEFDTGAVKNAMILSVPEGHDKPLKYPLMFQVCDVVLVNKIDVLPYFDFDMDKCREYVALRNPNARVIPICARTGEGIDEWADWLKEQVRAWQA